MTKNELKNRARIISRGLMESLPQADSVAVHPYNISRPGQCP